MVIGKVAFANTSMGSPSSRLFWQACEFAGCPGNCQLGVMLSRNGSPKISAVSCERAVTSWNPPPKMPGEIQLAYWVTQRDCGMVPDWKKKVWNPSTQHPPGALGSSTLSANRKVLGNN